MQKLIRSFVIALIMTVACAASFAQPNPTQKRISREQLAELQAKHIAHELAFTDEVTEKFVKTFCDYQKEIWALRPRRQPANANKPRMSEQESEARIKQRFERSEKILGIRQKYYKEYSKFLTQAQIEQVYKQERLTRARLAKRKNTGGKSKADGKPRKMRPNNE